MAAISESNDVKMKNVIDLHHHFIPPAYAKALEGAGGDPSGWAQPKWSPSTSQDIMRQLGVSTAILSLTAPGVEIERDTKKQRALARDANEYAAQVRDSNPKSFGFFAAVPSLLDTEGAIEEIRYALDVLHADGITLFTRYGESHHYLGHERFIPIWRELNDRRALVFIHPTHPVDTHLVNPSLPNPVIDYPHETSRTAMDLILSNRKREYRNVKILLSHAGGTLPFVIDRAAKLVASLPTAIHKKSENEIKEDAKSFYVDLALSTSSSAISAVQEFFPPDHIVFGSDFPYAPAPAVLQFSDQLRTVSLNGELRKKIYYENALKLIPRLNDVA